MHVNLLLINSLEIGGAEKLNVSLLNSNGFQKLIILHKKNELNVDHTAYFSLNATWNKGFFSYFEALFLGFKLIYYLRRNYPSIKRFNLLVSLPKSGLVSVIAKKIGLILSRKITITYWEHADPNYYTSPPITKITNYLYNYADHIICNSRRAKEEVLGKRKGQNNRVQCIYNFFDFERVRSMLPSTGKTKNDTYTFICVSRLHQGKGIDHLIKVFNILIRDKVKCRLILVGDGTMRENLNQLVQQLNLGEDVLFTGFQNNPYQHIYNADCLIFPSEQEGFGNVILESIIVGTPVIACDIDNGPREILAPATDIHYRTKIPEFADFGILMPSFKKDMEERAIPCWADSLKKIVNDPTIIEKYRNLPLKKFAGFEIKHQVENILKIVNSD